jgi:Bacterial Ig-like domain (group 2)
VIRPALLIPALLLAACSNLTEGAGGVVALEIQQPASLDLEIGETLALTAQALDKDGNPVDAAVTWRAVDPTLTVDPATGVITGVSAGSGRVQAFAGDLSSGLLQFSVVPAADTLIVTTPIVTVAPGAPASAPLVAALQSFTAGPLQDRPIIYAIIDPPETVPHLVELPGGVLTDTLNTGTDGAVSSVTLNRATLAQPDTAIVEVRAFRTRGAPVAGSGQRFTVIFQ